MTGSGDESSNDAIAIVGMALRVPGAVDVSEYWRNLERGVESIRSLSDEELRDAGVTESRLRDARYVKRAATLSQMEWFDGEFFGFSPKESAILDPQHRHFLECAWEALEHAGHDPDRFEGAIGVFAGCGMGAYFAYNLLSRPDLIDEVGLFLLRHTGNDKDFLATRASYCLDLKGPSINVQTACSTSLVATHLACQSLLSRECDLALAGGVTIEIPHARGYLYKDNEILSPDGRCRAFDHHSRGTVFGSGAGLVVLRRLEDALADADHIWAIIRGSAINNDGAQKVGYLAPSVEGQAAAIAEAIAMADVGADTIGYVECHGTGTPMGDPIEIAALTQAFRESSDGVGFCRIGSVKTNIGHLDTAAGVASLIKASLAVAHGVIPPSLHFDAPNPELGLESTPFVVAAERTPWPRTGHRRRAGVNSLGVGGTNAHLILEEAPPCVSGQTTRAAQPLVLSARTKGALDEAGRRLAAHLRANPDLALADVAWTLASGRRAFAQRRVLAASDVGEAAALLDTCDPQRVFTHVADGERASVAFLFPGGGAQYPAMGRGLYETEPVFAEHIDRGLELLRGRTAVDLRELLLADPDDARAAELLQRPSLQLPAIFLVEYALAQLWLSRGLRPAALAGHSMGENTAACVAGVLSFADALGLVRLRGELFERVAGGGMLSVPLAATEVEAQLGDDLELAVINAPELCVVSGPAAAIGRFAEELVARGVEAKPVGIDVAAHSRLLEPILAEFGAYLRSVQLQPPTIPFVSNRSGTWITDAEATDPDYWVAHLRGTVRFADCLGTLLSEPDRVLLEVGPGRILSSLARMHPQARGRTGVPSLRHPEESTPDAVSFATALARLWASGVDTDLAQWWSGESRRRVPLPTYAFQRRRYWIEPGTAAVADDEPRRLQDLDDWFARPVWEPASLADGSTPPATWLVFVDECGLGERLGAALRGAGHDVITVREGDAFYRVSDGEYTLSAEQGPAGYAALVRELTARGKVPSHVAHLWLVTAHERFRPGSSFFHRNLEQGFTGLLSLAQAFGEEGVRSGMHWTVVSTGMQSVAGEPVRNPEKATVLGPARVIPREFPGWTVASVDLQLPDLTHRWFGLRRARAEAMDALADQVLRELGGRPGNRTVALRGGQRFEERTRRCSVTEAAAATSLVRDGGVYLITGGLGGLGLVVAEQLVRNAGVRLVLVARRSLPPASLWDDWLAEHAAHEPTSQLIVRLRGLQRNGAEIVVETADVTDVEAMRAIVDRARARFGGVDGVVHTAGVLRDEPIIGKSQAAIESVFAPKLYGTQVLQHVFAADELEFLALFSSISTHTAAAGQVDYVAANAFLNAYALSRPLGRTRVLAWQWGIWRDVGMAAAALGGQRDAAAELARRPAFHPWLDRRIDLADGRVRFETDWTPRDLWMLDEHRTAGGDAVIPGTGYLELARLALVELGESTRCELRDVVFFAPLQIGDDERRAVRIELGRRQHGYAMTVQSRRTLEDGRAGWQTHAQMQILWPVAEVPAPVPCEALRQTCVDRIAEAATGLRAAQEVHLRFGPRWRVLRRVGFAADQAFADLALDSRFADDLLTNALHPGLVDLATGFAMDLIDGYRADEALWVPVSYGRVRILAPLVGEICSHVRRRGEAAAADGFARFDVDLADRDGRVLVQVEDFAVRRLDGSAAFGVAGAVRAEELELEAVAAGSGDPSPGERALLHNLANGIGVEEGREALARLLTREAPAQVMITSLEVDAIRRQIDRLAAAGDHRATSFARPELDSDFVEARDDVERTLVGFWQELLGVDRVGVNDSFFDLGGHSLIAVRLFAKIKKAFAVDWPISVLFESSTVEGCAARIRAAIGADGHDRIDEVRPRYLHLVPMHPGEGGTKTPFFLVAGMFGNVLNLRHLAHLIGLDRPFYGLQARGLYGDARPHETFEEAARDYLAEIRSVQPHGPYLLGGFSGGGITAWEMARQLRDAGEEVALIAMLDTPLPEQPPLTRIDRLRIHGQRLRRAGPRYLWDWAAARCRWEIGRLRGRLAGDEQAAAPNQLHDEVIEAAFRRALARYRLMAQPIDVVLFRPRLDGLYRLGGDRHANDHQQLVLPDNGWTPFVRGLVVHEMPGTHDSMVLEPNVRVLANRLRIILDAAGTRPASDATASTTPQDQRGVVVAGR